MSWRDDPDWLLVQYDAEFFGDETPSPRPTSAAELAQPDSWASLYSGRRIVATWSRVRHAPSVPASTIPVP